MKKIILATLVAFSVFAADAQTTKAKKSRKSKKTYVSPAAKAKAKQQAEYARIKRETDKKIEDYKMASFQADSMRIDSERVARETFEMERKTYLETKAMEQDSLNKATYKRLGEEKELSIKTEQSLDAINKAANLGSYEGRQVKIINQTYYDKARAVKDDINLTDEQRKTQLIALNAERRAKIRIAVGSAKDKKIEKERKEYVKKYGQDKQAQWIDEAEGYAHNK